MKLWLNCQNDPLVFTKKIYLLRAAKRLGIDWVEDFDNWNHSEPIEYILNIEPFTSFIKGSKWTGVWEIDIIRDRPQLSLSDWAVADDIFLANYALPEKYLSWVPKTTLLFQACDPELHRPMPEIAKEYDIAFAGSLGAGYDKRNQAFEILKEHFSFKSFGKEFIPEEYVKICNKSRIQFIKTCNTYVADSHLAQRFFELLAIGPVITNWDKDIVYTGLIEGRDFLTYKDDKEMVDKVRFLLDEPEFADRIARNGRKKALSMHTFEHRLMSIVNIIKYGRK